MPPVGLVNGKAHNEYLQSVICHFSSHSSLRRERPLSLKALNDIGYRCKTIYPQKPCATSLHRACQRSGVSQELRRKAVPREAGLSNVHPHTLRHSTGYNLVNRGTDLRLIQSFMGHKSINSTIRYTAVDTKRYAKLF